MVLFIGGPLLLLAFRKPGLLFLALWAGGFITYRLSRGAQPVRGEHQLGRILLRFLALGLLLTIATWLVFPALFLELPRTRPELWAVIMGLYPLLSVWPQEVIYRRFLFVRYQRIFADGAGLIAASALAFGFAHVIFLNWIAVAMTMAGGAMFAYDYARHRNLGLACVEHSLYGCLVFTIGLGRFFYTGAAWHH